MAMLRSQEFASVNPPINATALKLATTHFGDKWFQFLKNKGGQINISTEKIREMVAICYSQMGEKPLEQLLISFFHVGSSTSQGAGISFNVTVGADNYLKLHETVHYLIVNGQFYHSQILSALLDLSEQARQEKIRRENSDRQMQEAKSAKTSMMSTSASAPLQQNSRVSGDEIPERRLLQRLGRPDSDDENAELQNTHTEVMDFANIQIEPSARITSPSFEKVNEVVISGKQEFEEPLNEEPINPLIFDEPNILEETNIVDEPTLGDFPVPRPLPEQDPSVIEIALDPVRINSETLVIEPSSWNNQNSYQGFDPYEYSLGKKYKKRLKLTPQQTKWLNKFWNYSNVFNSIEGCEIEIIKLYLSAVKVLSKKLESLGSSLDGEVEPLKTKTAEFERNQPYYWEGYNDSHLGSSAESDAYYYIYKKAESVIRDAWGHRRKITADYYSRSFQVKEIFENRLAPMIDDIIIDLITTIGLPDEPTEIALYAASTTRWRTEFQNITESYRSDQKDAVINSLYKLGHLNVKNPSVENVYYEASKFMVPFDRLESLKFYLHYIWHDLNSVVVDNKQLNKTIQKKLFDKEEQLANFQTIIDELSRTRELELSLAAVENVYKAKRKVISLDGERIKKVEQQHSGTVQVLNEYLLDEEESVEITIPVTNPKQERHSIAIETNNLGGDSAVSLDGTQLECLALFAGNGFMLPAQELDAFAKKNNQFKNQFIDGINDSCFELFDDVLIEETEDGYEINPNYYNQILN